MDWQLRIALLILGIGLIGFIVYDFKRRKKVAKEKQQLIDKMHQAAETVDSAGFDSTGVGSARKAHSEPTISEDFEEVGASQVEPSTIGDLTESATTQIKEAETNDYKTSSKNVGKGEQLSFAEMQEPEMVCSLILRAKEGESFKGSDFMPLFLSQGLRHGEMGIFHRYALQGGKPGPLLYSLANAVKPGTFDIENIERFETPAFAFFMTLPGPKDPVVAYEGMVKTIRMLKEELGGQILDETKSVYTEQTHQHQVEQIKSYQAKKSLV